MERPLINITIPTYNRGYCINKAIKAAFNQSYDNFSITVIDDGSSDSTYDCVKRYFDEPNFCYIRLEDNVGTAQAKNVSMMFSRYDAITFHDSDDIPDENKVLLQARALSQPGHVADSILNWRQMGYEPESEMEVDVVVGAHKMIKLDGSVHMINKRMSLVDDFFPNLQFPSKTEGDWILINSGLFRKKVFEEMGGYLDSVEEDRELRNRLISTGSLFFYVESPLLTKIEMGVSLTVSDDTGYKAERRRNDRQQVWDRMALFRRNLNTTQLKEKLQVKVNLSGIRFKKVSNPSLLQFNANIPHVEGSEAPLVDTLLRYS